ncbi:MAG: PEPxxWA-CTERM sorting domain-containing protein [Phenylobacterium sp.]|nr:PEPxxWA-CTERM sorting domain-containing protein [Phenylobacterium sp.]
MRRVLAGLAATAALCAAPMAHAAHYVLNLTGDADGMVTDSFSFGGVFFETGYLELSGFTPFVLEDGDTFEAFVTITGSNPPPFPTFIVPLRDQMFFGLNFADILGGAQPETSEANGLFSFDGGPDVGAGCGNCTSLIYGLNRTPFGFTTLVASGMFLMSEPYQINTISISYQVNNDAVGAVPEPDAWALMILGFGAAGALLRRSRRAGLIPAC